MSSEEKQLSGKQVLLTDSRKVNHNEVITIDPKVRIDDEYVFMVDDETSKSVVVDKMSEETAKGNQLSVNKISLRDTVNHSGNDNNNDKKESDPQVDKEIISEFQDTNELALGNDSSTALTKDVFETDDCEPIDPNILDSVSLSGPDHVLDTCSQENSFSVESNNPIEVIDLQDDNEVEGTEDVNDNRKEIIDLRKNVTTLLSMVEEICLYLR